MKQRVVTTGMGVISPVGNTKEDFWRSLVEGESGINTITRFDSSDFATRIAGEVRSFDYGQYLDKKEARRMDRFAQYGVAAAQMALKDAGLDLKGEDLDRWGVVFGSGIGGMETFEDQTRVLVEKGPGRVSPFFVPMMIANMAAGQISINLGLKGPNFTTVNACASGANAIGSALRLLQNGEADAVVAGGSEASVTPMALAGFCAMKALSTRNHEPQRASRPFDRDRDGFVLSEGAGAIILETLDHALARGAEIYGEVVGYGCTADAYHITAPAPGGEGAIRAMRAALADAGLAPGDINYINAHGTSTELNDQMETLAIKEVFKESAYQIPVSSTKSVTGHLLGAAGAIEAMACLLAIRQGVVPPTINLDEPDPDCDLDYVPWEARQVRVEVALSNSLGFGGHNATLIFKRFKG